MLLVTKGLDIGGIERIVVDLAVGLARRQTPVEVAVVNDARDGLAGVLRDAAVSLRALGGGDRIGPAATRRLVQLARSGRYDVVHVHGPLPAIPVRLARSRVPIVTTSHTLWSALRLPVRMAWRVTSSMDAASVAVSGAVLASLPASIAARTRVIPHGVDPEAIAAAKSAGGGEKAGVRLVAVASHRDVKNYPNLLRGVQLARDLGAAVELVAVGDGPNLERHRALARELGLADAVTFQPPSRDVLGIISGADILVVASDFEGQPLVVSEALALGIPVVATAVGRIPELISPTVGRIVAPGDPGALGKAIAELATDDDLRTGMSRAAPHTGLRWTLDDALDAHEALYQDVLRR